MRKSLRYLRVAFSATCLIACVLLIVLWVRSYTIRNDELSYVDSSNRGWHFASLRGGMLFCMANYSPAKPGAWRMYTAWERELLGFGAFATNTSTSFGTPYWFPVLTSIAFASLPWIHWSKRFSLRTLLIATTLVALVLGLAVYAARQ
jgi:hypothetical protein